MGGRAEAHGVMDAQRLLRVCFVLGSSLLLGTCGNVRACATAATSPY